MFQTQPKCVDQVRPLRKPRIILPEWVHFFGAAHVCRDRWPSSQGLMRYFKYFFNLEKVDRTFFFFCSITHNLISQIGLRKQNEKYSHFCFSNSLLVPFCVFTMCHVMVIMVLIFLLIFVIVIWYWNVYDFATYIIFKIITLVIYYYSLICVTFSTKRFKGVFF